jgi:hypothetical protein
LGDGIDSCPCLPPAFLVIRNDRSSRRRSFDRCVPSSLHSSPYSLLILPPSLTQPSPPTSPKSSSPPAPPVPPPSPSSLPPLPAQWETVKNGFKGRSCCRMMSFRMRRGWRGLAFPVRLAFFFFLPVLPRCEERRLIDAVISGVQLNPSNAPLVYPSFPPRSNLDKASRSSARCIFLPALLLVRSRTDKLRR